MAEKTPMSAEERELAQALTTFVRFAPTGSADQRFARRLAALALQPEAALDQKQRDGLRYLRKRYRRQLPARWRLAPAVPHFPLAEAR
jgi:hypothetical protein